MGRLLQLCRSGMVVFALDPNGLLTDFATLNYAGMGPPRKKDDYPGKATLKTVDNSRADDNVEVYDCK